MQLYSKEEQANFMQLFSKLSYPASYSKHIAYMDFDHFNNLSKMPEMSGLVEDKSFSYKQPIFINMVEIRLVGSSLGTTTSGHRGTFSSGEATEPNEVGSNPVQQ